MGVARDTGLVAGASVVTERSLSAMQALVNTHELVDANLRTYLKRLARRCRCFSCSVAKLWQAVRHFV